MGAARGNQGRSVLLAFCSRAILLLGLWMGNASLHAADYVLTPGEPLTIDLSKPVDSVQVTLPEGLWVLRAEQEFAEVSAIIIRDGQPLHRLDNMDYGNRPAEAIVESDRTQPFNVDITVRHTRALRPLLTLEVRPANEFLPATLAAIRSEAKFNQLPQPIADNKLDGALATMQEATALWLTIDKQRAAKAMLAVAQLLRDKGDTAAAFDTAAEAADIAADVSDPLMQGMALNSAGLYAIYLRREDVAIELLTHSEALLQPAYDAVAVSPAEANLCFTDFRFRRYEVAERCYKRLIKMAETVNDVAGQTWYQNLVAGTHSLRHDPLTAIDYLRKALDLADRTGDQQQRAQILNNIGIQYRRGGRYQDAMTAYQASLEIYEATGREYESLQVVSNIGILYGQLGDISQAKRFLERAHTIASARRNADLTQRKRNLATAHIKLGETSMGIALLQEAIALANELALSESAKRSLVLGLALAKIENGNTQSGRALLTELLDDANLPKTGGESDANAYTSLARLLIKNGQLAQAEEMLSYALEINQRVKLPVGTARTQAASARLALARANYDKAQTLARDAIDTIEGLRGNIANPELRAIYQATLIEAYELAIFALMRDDNSERIVDALLLAEGFRARTLVDSLMQSEAATASEIPQELQRQRATLQARINRAETRRLRNRPAEDIDTIINELNVLDAKIADADPRLAAALAPPSLAMSDIQSQLTGDDLALQYFLGEEESLLWTITSETIGFHRLPPAAEIDSLSRELYSALETRRRYQPLAEALGELLLAPVLDELDRYQNITIVADKALHYVPFDVLTTTVGNKPTLLERQVSYQPSLTTLALQRATEPRQSNRAIAVVADPIYSADDKRVIGNPGVAPSAETRGNLILNRLQMSGREASTIAELAENRATDIRTGYDANAQALHSDTVRNAQIVHIAAHGFVDDDNSAKTGLAFSMLDEDGDNTVGFVGLREINQLRLNAELVVLSACDTALGRNLAGEGLLGLTRGFMFAGADRVVASLWQVEDRATAELMEHFYRALLKDSLPPAAALAYAKREMRKKRQWRHPYYWSGIVLMGDWRELSN